MPQDAICSALVMLAMVLGAMQAEVRGEEHRLECAGITWGGDTLELGQIGIIGQSAVGTASNDAYTLEAGIVPCLSRAPATDNIPPQMPDPDLFGSHLPKNRYISLVIPPAAPGTAEETAIRVRLTSLHHPGTPANPPDFTDWEGNYRWVNAVDVDPAGGLHTCDDSLALHTTFRCAKLGCTPEYRDWAGELGGAALHVTGAAVVPSSTYDAAQLAASCEGNEASCAAVSEELSIFTTLFGNVDSDPQLNVLDVAAVVDKVKDLPSAFIKPRTQLQPDVPDPTANVNVLDAATAVDALKGKAYGYFGDFGPCTDHCPGEAACP